MGRERKDSDGEIVARAASGILAFLPLAACSFFLNAAQANAPLFAQAIIFTCAFAVASFAYDVLKRILTIKEAYVRPLLRKLLEMYVYVIGYVALVGSLALIQLKVEITSAYLPWAVVAATGLFMWLATRAFVDAVLDFSGQ